MKILSFGMIISLLTPLTACGSDSEETNVSQEPAQSGQGILTNSQQQALDSARTVEQTLLDAAEQRERELEERLRSQ
ncbi:MAG: hypothetical protein GKR91_06205 [Pseudomonadales bacterium]|nr:hypothetical protein [Pseudomonadales bacterium]